MGLNLLPQNAHTKPFIYWIMFHEHLFLHTHIVPPPCESVWETQNMSFLCVWDHVNTCHNCMWMYKWYIPPKMVYVSLLLYIYVVDP